MIPAVIAYRTADPERVAHAVGEHSERTFCGVWATCDTDRAWPASSDRWSEEHPRCPVCSALVYA